MIATSLHYRLAKQDGNEGLGIGILRLRLSDMDFLGFF